MPYTDSIGNIARVGISTNSSGNATSVTFQPPAATTPTTAVTFDANNHVSNVVRNGVTTNYAFSLTGSTGSASVQRAGNPARTLSVDILHARITSDIDPQSNKTTYAYNPYNYDWANVLTTKTFPEGNSLNYTYDSRSNVTQIIVKPKPGSTLVNIVATAGFDASCVNAVKCNQPNWTKDALGNETDYIYDATSGLVTSVTGPAAPNGLRPQVRETYTATGGVQLLTGTSTCHTRAGTTVTGTAGIGPFALSGGAACAGTSDETKTTITFDGNLRPATQTIAAGDNSISVTTSQTYTTAGDVATSVGPLGSSQTTYNFYDAGRRLTGNIAPDPDGTGPRTPAAVQYSYNADGVLTAKSVGTVPNQATTQASFTEVFHVATTLDAYDRPIRIATVSSATTYAVTDQLYDSTGRPWCSVQYMNLSNYPASPTTSCAAYQATGPYGPDRIVQATFDADSRVLITSTGIGVVNAVAGYNPNGTVQAVIDGQNNRTSYIYDGFDRLSQTNFPVATPGANASDVNNYETQSYTGISQPYVKRQRDGSTITNIYDNLGNLQTVSRSDQVNFTYTYNLVNQLTNLARPTDGTSWTYDSLGRVLSEANPEGNLTYQYDAAGDRTRITWADGFYAGYTYDTVGLVTSITENGATTGVGLLASYWYDNLGRRSSVTYGNGTGSAYSYDPVGRLSSLALTFPNAPDYNHTISVNAYTPSSQIASITRSNDTFAWTGVYNVNRPYIINGLNQVTNATSTTASGTATTAFGYDGRGNLNSSGASSYIYSLFNELNTAPGGSMAYDTLSRLDQYTTAAGTSYLYYSGTMLAAETSGNAITQRYVPGPGTDEPIVWYVGNTNANRRFLMSDERGSIIATSDSSGAMLGVNSYDEYGIPAAANIGRFQYTGQAWFSEIGLQYSKARWYSPTLGRFMQTDPIGYGNGLNWYNYAGSDPINAKDPTGLQCFEDSSGNLTCDGNDPGAEYTTSDGSTIFDPGDGTVGPVVTGQKGTNAFDSSFSSISLQFQLPPLAFNLPAIGPVQPQSGNGKPAYCSSLAYRVGSFIDQAGGVTKTAGTGIVLAGGAIGLSTAITGVGAGAGGAVAGAGGSVYLTGAAVSLVGNSVKWLASGGSNYDSANVLSGAFEVPIAGALGPVSRTVVGNVADRLMGDGMGQKNPCGE